MSYNRAFKYLVESLLPPNTVPVMWTDISCPDVPVLKIFNNGRWKFVHTDRNKEIETLLKILNDYKNSETILESINNLQVSLKENLENIITQIKDLLESSNNNKSECKCDNIVFKSIDKNKIQSLFSNS